MLFEVVCLCGILSANSRTLISPYDPKKLKYTELRKFSFMGLFRGISSVLFAEVILALINFLIMYIIFFERFITGFTEVK